MKLSDLGLLFLRVMTGVGIAIHGYGKVFGNMDGMVQGVAAMGFPMPVVFAWAAALSEFAGGILLALGFLSRLSALMIFITMSVAAFITHAADPLKVKELAYAYWTMSGALVILGAGSLSLDQIFFSRPAPKKN